MTVECSERGGNLALKSSCDLSLGPEGRSSKPKPKSQSQLPSLKISIEFLRENGYLIAKENRAALVATTFWRNQYYLKWGKKQLEKHGDDPIRIFGKDILKF